MRKTRYSNTGDTAIMLTVEQLQERLNCGYQTAVRIGTEAKARVCYGRRVWYNVDKVREYLASAAF